MADDLGIGDLNCFNPDSPIATPNLDKLASDGIKFTQVRASSPICSPSRLSLLNGHYPNRFNFRTIINNHDCELFNGEPEDNIFSIMDKGGYNVIHIGKQHYNNSEEHLEQTKHYSIVTNLIREENGYFSNFNVKNKIEETTSEYEGHNVHITELHFRKAESLIDESIRKKEPFYLQLFLYNPHILLDREERNFVSPTTWEALYSNDDAGNYCAVISYMDYLFGEFINRLEEQNILDNTIIIFTSDNGAIDPKLFNTNWSNRNHRGSKTFHFDAGLRVPLIIAHGGVEKGKVKDCKLNFLDLFVTIIKLGNPQFNIENYPGKEFTNTLFQNNTEDENTFNLRNFYWEGSNRRNYKEEMKNCYPFAILDSNNFKLVYEPKIEKDTMMLFDLNCDPHERNNISEEYPGKTQNLYNDYLKWSLNQSEISCNTSQVYKLNYKDSVSIGYDKRMEFSDRDFTIRFNLFVPKDKANTGLEKSKIVSKEGSWQILIGDSGNFGIQMTDIWNKTYVYTPREKIKFNRWNDIQLSMRGYPFSGTHIRLYINEKLVIKRGVLQRCVGVKSSGNPISLHNKLGSFSIQIKDIRMYNRELLAHERAQEKIIYDNTTYYKKF